MKANELRIGNLVKPTNPRHNEKYVEVESITVEKINIDFREYSLDKIEPIPLTEEWLLKFGFNIKESVWFSKKTKIQWTRFEVCIEDKRCILYNSKQIIYCDMLFTKYVHQLQNLYFALTGEELTIK